MSDPFDDLLGLEDRFYDEGYKLGVEDGGRAGRIEGRVFGLEKGFEKYVEMGRLHGRSLIWNGRHPKLQSPESRERDPSDIKNPEIVSTIKLTNLPSNPRLEKHLRVLYALTEPASLSTENTEEAVSDFDDRLKRAQGKMKIIERLVAEESLDIASASSQGAGQSSGQNIEDVDILKARH